MAGYVTAILAFVRAEIDALEASSFGEFWKIPLAISLCFTSFLVKQTFVFWDVLGKEYYS